jgi:hypothetical protein
VFAMPLMVNPKSDFATATAAGLSTVLPASDDANCGVTRSFGEDEDPVDFVTVDPSTALTGGAAGDEAC